MTVDEFIAAEKKRLTVFAKFRRQIHGREDKPSAWWKEQFRRHEANADLVAGDRQAKAREYQRDFEDAYHEGRNEDENGEPL